MHNTTLGKMFTSQYTVLECQPITNPHKWKPNHIELAPNCPRCASPNTKFCYYNNYSLSQPRYFCKGCRRYWTKGGSLRNVPVGGGCRKGRRRARSTTQGAGANHTSPVGSSIHAGSINVSENNTNIDMAAVFAKYVNPDVSVEDSPSPRASIESTDYVQTGSWDINGTQNEVICTSIEYPESLGLANGVEDVRLEQLLPQLSIHGDFHDQDFLYQGSNADFDMHGILDQLGTGSDGTNFGSHQLMQDQFHDLGLFPSDDPVSNNWDSFNLPCYHNF